MYLANARKSRKSKSKAASKPSRHRKHAKRSPAKRKAFAAKGARVVTSRSGLKWTKTASGQWVKVGQKSPGKKAAKKPYAKKSYAKKGKTSSGSNVGANLLKAKQLVQGARHAAKGAAADKLLNTIVRGLGKLIAQV